MPTAGKVGETFGISGSTWFDRFPIIVLLGLLNWSGASSLVYSSGPSSPNAFDDVTVFRGANEEHLRSSNNELNRLCEVSTGGSLAFALPQTPGLDQDLSSVGILLENSGDLNGSNQADLNESDSGETTPVSVGSEFEFRNLQDSEESSRSDLNKNSPKLERRSKGDESTNFGRLDEEAIKMKFDKNLSRLEDGRREKEKEGEEEEEEDEEDKTITTVSLPPRESIVGFFKESQNDGSDTKNEEKAEN